MTAETDQAAGLRAAAKAGAANTAAKASPFDFRSPPQHNKTQLRSLKLLHEGFCAPLAGALAAAAGRPCKVSLDGLSAEKFEAAGERVYVSLEEGPRRALLAMDKSLIWLLLERLLGGGGEAAAAPARAHTLIERRVLAQTLMGRLAACYGETWAGISAREFSFGKFEDDPCASEDFAKGSEVASAVYSVSLGGTEGKLAVLLPFSSLRPLLQVLAPAKILMAGRGPAPAGPAPRGALLSATVSVKVILGRIDIRLKDLNGLAAGDVLRLDARPDGEVVVEVEQQPRFAGKPGRAGKLLGVQITRKLEEQRTKDGEEHGKHK